jgi:hypothetical protein
VSLETKEKLAQLVLLYSKRFDGGGPPMNAPAQYSDEQLVAMLEQALQTDVQIPGWDFDSRFDLRRGPKTLTDSPEPQSAPPSPAPQGMSSLEADSETRGFQRHLKMGDLKGKPRG